MKGIFRICDTTLRDGEQMPGVVFKPRQKRELAQKISDFGVDIIELMPTVSPSEAQVTRTIANLGLRAEITASTMLRKEDIELAASCNVDSVTLFTPLSDIHLKHKLGINRDENLTLSLEIIDDAKSHGLKIHFAGEDATRADINYIIEFINAISKDIGYFLVCDTLGCLTPSKTYSFFKEICTRSKSPIALHAHNDFGMATANTLAGLEAGASVFSGTFTGIGERAGNAPLEEVIGALKFLYNRELDVDYSALTELCNLVEDYSGVTLQAHKPLIGRNAFSHESGIHADGIIKHASTYENFPPEIIGQQRRFLFGKHSGRRVLQYALGRQIPDDEVSRLLEKIKSIAETEKRSLSLTEVMSIHKNLDFGKERAEYV